MSAGDGWLSVGQFCAKHSIRINTIHKWIADGAFVRGEMYSAPSGGTGYMHEEKVLAWMQANGKLSDQSELAVARQEL